MNLHGIVFSQIGAVNPNQIVAVQISVGSRESADGLLEPTYATPGSITASIGGTFTASADGSILIVSAVLSGTLQPGDAVSGTDGANALPAGTTVLQQLSGTAGGVGTYELNQGTLSGTLNACEVTAASTVLNVSAVAGGVLQPGQTLEDEGALLPGTLITGFGTGDGAAGTYNVSQAQTVPAEVITTSMTILAQVQPLAASDLRHMDMLNLQGSHRALYVAAPIQGISRPAMKGGDLITLPDGSVWLVNQPLESFFASAGWNKFAITLQPDALIGPNAPSDNQPGGVP